MITMTIWRMARGNAKSIGLSPWKTPLEVAFIKAGQAEVFAAILADKKKEASSVPGNEIQKQWSYLYIYKRKSVLLKS